LVLEFLQLIGLDFLVSIEDKIKLLGDCLTASSFLSYTGPFNFILRQKMIFDEWKKDIIAKEIPTNEVLKLETFLVDEVIVSRWASEGLKHNFVFEGEIWEFER
jgi:hypothetical protein